MIGEYVQLVTASDKWDRFLSLQNALYGLQFTKEAVAASSLTSLSSPTALAYSKYTIPVGNDITQWERFRFLDVNTTFNMPGKATFLIVISELLQHFQSSITKNFDKHNQDVPLLISMWSNWAGGLRGSISIVNDMGSSRKDAFWTACMEVKPLLTQHTKYEHAYNHKDLHSDFYRHLTHYVQAPALKPTGASTKTETLTESLKHEMDGAIKGYKGYAQTLKEQLPVDEIAAATRNALHQAKIQELLNGVVPPMVGYIGNDGEVILDEAIKKMPTYRYGEAKEQPAKPEPIVEVDFGLDEQELLRAFGEEDDEA